MKQIAHIMKEIMTGISCQHKGVLFASIKNRLL
jgi:hypothetical protein